jgi:hypothetical protein
VEPGRVPLSRRGGDGRAVLRRKGRHLLDKSCRLRGKDAIARKAENVFAVSLLVVDIDDGGQAALGAVLERLGQRGVRHWWHTTHTSSDRFRVIVPLSEAVPAERWWDFWHYALKALGAKASADLSCKDPCRLYYLPATALDRDDEGASGGARSGRAFDVQTVYARGAWPVQPRRGKDAAPKVFPPATETQLWAAGQDLEKFGDAVQGQHGDSRTFTAAAILTHDWALTPAEAWPLLQRWNARHARPAWGEEDLAEKLENAGAYAKDEYGHRREARNDYQLEVARVEAELELRLGSSTPRTAPAKWKPVDELLGEDFPRRTGSSRGCLRRTPSPSSVRTRRPRRRGACSSWRPRWRPARRPSASSGARARRRCCSS